MPSSYPPQPLFTTATTATIANANANANTTTTTTSSTSTKMSSSTPPKPTSLPPTKPLPAIPSKSLAHLSARPPTPYSPQNCKSRRDSDTLPSNSHQLKNLTINHYHHIEIHPASASVPAMVQYWVSADDVLNDRLKETKVPSGHWPKLVQLANDVCGERSINPQKEVRILTAFYSPNEEMKVEMKVESLPAKSE